MNELGTRTLVSELVEDLSWLEEHCRRQPKQAIHAGQLRLAAALVRNCIGPFLDDQPARPLHIAVVGGAGAGKSTVVNLLTGAGLAEANPQAGFTRHPVAYAAVNGSPDWTAHVDFLKPLRRLEDAGPANLDEDVYQVRTIPPEPLATHLLKDFVIWDSPDMTTWAATDYVPRLLEIAGLADIILYVASDERYNDEVPTQFLHMLLQTGKPVIVCLMKMKEEDTASLVNHFQQEVLGRFAHDAVACVAIPFMTAEQLADPVRLAARYRITLVNQVAVVGDPPEMARRRVVAGAARYLLSHSEQLLAAARQDLAALEEWRSTVQAGQVEFDNRYRREYLSSEKFQSFDEALVRLLDLLELPGVGKVVSTTLWVVRTPYRLLKAWLGKALSRADTPGLPELPVLEQALHGWLDMLHKEAVRRADNHGVWEHIEKGFNTDLANQVRERFQQGFRSFRISLADEVDRTARAIYEELERNPVMLNTLRSGNFALDVAAIVGAFTIGHMGVQDFVLVPLLASLKQQIVELLGKQYVDNQRELIRTRQQLLEAQYISSPLAEWLVQWPATGGSTFERLQVALRRIPPVIRQLDSAVEQALSRAEHR